MAHPDNFNQAAFNHRMAGFGYGSNSGGRVVELQLKLKDIERRSDAVQNELNRLDEQWSETNNELKSLEVAC
ncbi:hypothetical protein JK203_08930 [Gluconobacter cerinus]|uniref:hypothetical protein n=1 Tax=Gluconobacter cerinus TaxID=38307 RepID=UPI001B8A9F4D|nr:hypothetical protein [Gluconobacter cerinus]MBS1040972.1 hypothetical protein [Gluconobacter cerinus]MBS1047967.1 hypothetical protein [Gluconobacter cerinus]